MGYVKLIARYYNSESYLYDMSLIRGPSFSLTKAVETHATTNWLFNTCYYSSSKLRNMSFLHESHFKLRFCGNGVYGWPAVPRGWTKRGPTKGLCAAGAHDDAVNQVGEGVDHDDNGVRVSNEALRATIRKSREVLAMHRDLLDQLIQIPEKKKLISIIEASSIHNGQEPFSGSPFSRSDAVSEGEEIGYDLQMYLDRRSQKSEIRSTHGESISGQHEYYGSLEGKLSNADVNGSYSKVSYVHYLYKTFSSAAPNVYEPQSVNGMEQDYEKGHSVTEEINDNSSSSAAVDVMNIILVAAECAPWSKTGKNDLINLHFSSFSICKIPDSNLAPLGWRTGECGPNIILFWLYSRRQLSISQGCIISFFVQNVLVYIWEVIYFIL
uniref:Starch synthase catalytic domain-containing protein n=1 Tax=Aegilops tauschii TaxID=37682 RepID=R7WD08_AEGTA